MRTGDAIRHALDATTTAKGALADALDEAVNGEGSPVTAVVIQRSLARAARWLDHAAQRVAALRTQEITPERPT